MTKSTRDWFELLICIAMIEFGIAALINLPKYGGVTINRFPIVASYALVILMLVAASLTVFGVIRSGARDPRKGAYGVLMERSGVYLLGSFAVAYSLWAVMQFGTDAFGFVLLWAHIAVASFLRGWDISRAGRRVAKHGN